MVTTNTSPPGPRRTTIPMSLCAVAVEKEPVGGSSVWNWSGAEANRRLQRPLRHEALWLWPKTSSLLSPQTSCTFDFLKIIFFKHDYEFVSCHLLARGTHHSCLLFKWKWQFDLAKQTFCVWFNPYRVLDKQHFSSAFSSGRRALLFAAKSKSLHLSIWHKKNLFTLAVMSYKTI